ncbi:enoyl-CoA hydratase/isomerase family protein [Gordonia metallireducens]|uniref:enoyl-CoA hydratase/isomerase family protein n=1 Tax=Gordonia metallireducens TaxID=2897779 RepID=UPI001E56484B|nr:enoyl-CoA hydratase-related protein [Gordonia metallireducens]
MRTLTLNRPERMNATTPAMRRRFFALLQEAEEDSGVRAVVVAGTGRGFWPGEDYAELARVDSAAVARLKAGPSYDFPMTMTTPIVAAVNGAVAGVGLSFALQADIRVAARGAKWAVPFASLGLVAEAGLSWLLQRHVSRGAALELLLTAEPFSSEDAYRMGIVQHLVDADEVLPTAQRIADRIARNAPFSIRNIREQVLLDATRPWREAYDDGSRRAVISLGRDDFRKAAAAARDKRQFTFEGDDGDDH